MYIAKLTYERIVDLSEKKNIKIGEINKICSISKDTLSSAAKSKEGMKAKRLYDISELLDCSVDYLLGKTDNPNAHKPQTSNSVNGNYNAVDNSSVTVNTPVLDEHQKLLIELYNKLSPMEQIELIAKLNDTSKNQN